MDDSCLLWRWGLHQHCHLMIPTTKELVACHLPEREHQRERTHELHKRSRKEPSESCRSYEIINSKSKGDWELDDFWVDVDEGP